eukprot:scaffold103716_cov30-Phaeocystis_antarctica.AAC.1
MQLVRGNDRACGAALRRLPSSVCVLARHLASLWQPPRLAVSWLWQPESLVNSVLDTRRRLTMHP